MRLRLLRALLRAPFVCLMLSLSPIGSIAAEVTCSSSLEVDASRHGRLDSTCDPCSPYPPQAQSGDETSNAAGTAGRLEPAAERAFPTCTGSPPRRAAPRAPPIAA